MYTFSFIVGTIIPKSVKRIHSATKLNKSTPFLRTSESESLNPINLNRKPCSLVSSYDRRTASNGAEFHPAPTSSEILLQVFDVLRLIGVEGLGSLHFGFAVVGLGFRVQGFRG